LIINGLKNIDLFESQESKEYIQSPFNYTGSKSNLVSQFEKYFPSDTKRCVDLFCGGGGFFINVLDKFPLIVANDIIKPLMEFYIFLQDTSWDEVILEISKHTISQNSHE
jgi:site-specific DNA-adenine methylase